MDFSTVAIARLKTRLEDRESGIVGSAMVEARRIFSFGEVWPALKGGCISQSISLFARKPREGDTRVIDVLGYLLVVPMGCRDPRRPNAGVNKLTAWICSWVGRQNESALVVTGA